MASNQDKSLPENCIVTDLPGLAGKRWLKGVALYGANASGKTTILKALGALAEMVKTSARMTDPNEAIEEIEPFALTPEEQKSPTAFSLALMADGVRYEYRVAATQQRVLHESLRAFPKAKEQLWFRRDWNAEAGSYAWSPERPTGFHRDIQLEGYTLSNMLFLSKAVANNRTELEPVFRWFKDQLKFLDLSAGNRLRLLSTIKNVQTQTPLRDRIIKLLLHADLGVTGARIVEHRNPEHEEILEKNMSLEAREKLIEEMDNWLKPELTHHGSGALELSLPWDSESAGTHRLFGLAGPWLNVLGNGHTVCVDELETSMHPLMVRELLRLFFNATENQKGAQVLFTTHNPLLLDATLLRRDQVWFTDKDDEGEAHLYPLTDFQPRKGESLVRGYLSGRYGAVPFVPTGLLGSFPSDDMFANSEKAAHE